MSEEGWRRFLAAEGLDDWVVLHGGATAVFVVPDLAAAGTLAAAVAAIPGLEGSGALLTVGERQLTVRLTRGMMKLESRHVDLARTISAVARRHEYSADTRAAQEVQIAVAAKPGQLHLSFWRAVLGYQELDEDNGADPLGHGSTFWMQPLDPEKQLRHAMHIDVSVGREHVQDRLQAALAAGGRIVDDSAAPEAWTLSDVAGNRVCIAAWPDGAEAEVPLG